MIAEAAAYDGTLRASVALKHLTSDLVGRFATAAVEATRAAWSGQSLCRYAADLEVPAVVAAEVALLKTVALRYVMSDPEHHRRQAAQRERIRVVCGHLLANAPHGLDPILLPWWNAAVDDADRVRVIVDQIASYTESRLERRRGRVRRSSAWVRRRAARLGAWQVDFRIAISRQYVNAYASRMSWVNMCRSSGPVPIR